MRRSATVRPWATDAVILCVVVVLSAALYFPRLGFYSDDWGFLGAFETAPDQSPGGLWHRQYQWHTTTRHRPTQIALQVALYWAFGLNPTPYHVANTIVLALLAVLLLAVLRRLDLPRNVAFAIPAVYLLLPNYSTNRFWFASFGYAVSMAFWALSLLGDLKALEATAQSMILWKLVAIASLVVSALGYEVVVPLLFVNVLVVWLRGRQLFEGGLPTRFGSAGAFLLLGTNLLALALVLLFKVWAVSRDPVLSANTLEPTLFHTAWVAYGAAKVNLGTYGLALPYAFMWSVRKVGTWTLLAAVVAGALVAGSIMASSNWSKTRHDGSGARGLALRLALVGLLVLSLGYAPFLATSQITFTSTGNGNRANMAGALGMAILLVALALRVSGLFARRHTRNRVFSVAVAALCMVGFLVNNALAEFWVRAWEREQSLTSSLQANVPDLPRRAHVLIDGVCPYAGPAVVLETWWDTSGLLQAIYGDETVQGDVTSGEVRIGRRGVMTTVYDNRFHRYEPRLLLFDTHRNTARPLTDSRTAIRAIGTKYSSDEQRCPEAIPGEGVSVLPFDHATLPFVARIAEFLR
jgi:hypothetical protein